MDKIRSAYKSLWSRISAAYKIYGGIGEFIRSPYLHIAMLAGIACAFAGINDWAMITLAVSPSLLGFTLAGYTVFIASVSGRLLRSLVTVESRPGVSYYQKINSAFFHFIFVQCIAISYAILSPAITSFSIPLSINSLPYAEQLNAIGYFIISSLGYSLIFYALFVVVAVLVWVFRIVSLSEKAVLKDIEEEKKAGGCTI